MWMSSVQTNEIIFPIVYAIYQRKTKSPAIINWSWGQFLISIETFVTDKISIEYCEGCTDTHTYTNTYSNSYKHNWPHLYGQ